MATDTCSLASDPIRRFQTVIHKAENTYDNAAQGKQFKYFRSQSAKVDAERKETNSTEVPIRRVKSCQSKRERLVEKSKSLLEDDELNTSDLKSNQTTLSEKKVYHEKVGGNPANFEINITTKGSTQSVGTGKGLKFRVYELKCNKESFPLLNENCTLGKDINVSFRKLPGITEKEKVELPYIAVTSEITMTVATQGEFTTDVTLVMGANKFHSCDVTDIDPFGFSFWHAIFLLFMSNADHYDSSSNTLKPTKGSVCLLVFPFNRGAINVEIEGGQKVLCASKPDIYIDFKENTEDLKEFKSEMTTTGIRKTLTHMLGEDLFKYAEEISVILDELSKEDSKLIDDISFQNTQGAVDVLRTRQVRIDSNLHGDSSCADKVSEELSEKLKRIENGRVLAFGLIAKSFMVFMDIDNTDDNQRNEAESEIKELCGNHIKFPPNVVWTSEHFLTYTGLEQGHIVLKQQEQDRNKQWGSIGMITEATVSKPQTSKTDNKTNTTGNQKTSAENKQSGPSFKPVSTASAVECREPNDYCEEVAINSGVSQRYDTGVPEEHKKENQTAVSEKTKLENIIVVVTAGHLFKENDAAYCIINGEEKKIGQCIASLHRHNDKEFKHYDVGIIHIDPEVASSSMCVQEFKNHRQCPCNCILYKNCMKEGVQVFMNVRNKSQSEYIEGVLYSNIELADGEKGYLIKGRGQNIFSHVGDSGSIAFTPNPDDPEYSSVYLLSIVSKKLKIPKDECVRLNIPEGLCYAVRLDKCLIKLEDLKQIKVSMPQKMATFNFRS